MAGLRREVGSKVAGEWRAAGWRGSQSGDADEAFGQQVATGSDAGTHRAIGSSTFADFVSGVAPAKGDLVID